MSPRTVRLASRLFAPEVGAAAFRLRMLADAFAERGLDVHVLTTTPPGDPRLDDGDLRVSRWPVLRDAGGNVRGYLQYLSFDLPLAVRMLASRPDVTIVEPPPTTGVVVRVASMIQRRPYVWYAGDVWSDGAASMGAPAPVVAVLAALEGWVVRGALRVIAVSDGVAERVCALGARPERVLVSGNGIDTAVFTPAGDAHEGEYLVYTGTMSEWQGAEIFVDALARAREQVPGLRIVFLGQGSAVDSIRERAARLVPGAVDLRGVVAPAECARWIRGARAALVSITPHTGYDFAKPTKIYAATGCGTPVIHAGVGAAQELVADEGLGWAPGYDVDGVAAAMVEAARADPAGRAARGARLVEWTARHASLGAAAGRVADDILAALRR